MKRHVKTSGFTLVEVALSLGLVGFALIAILGLIPVGQSVARASINETRAMQLAQQVFDTIRSQPFEQVSLDRLSNPSAAGNTFDLTSRNDAPLSPAIVYADNNGKITSSRNDNTAFAAAITFNNAPKGVPVAAASQVTARIMWGAVAQTGQLPKTLVELQSYPDQVVTATIISKYR